MTSRNLFFKWMQEDLKRKIWAIGLSFLMFFLWLPVMAAMRIAELVQQYDRWILNGTDFGNGITADMRFQQKLLDVVAETVGLANPMTALTIGVGAIVMALTGFLYLHSRKQTDFHHSIPVRREWMFAIKYLNGILIMLSMYLVNLLFAFGVLGMNGVDAGVMVPAGLLAFVVHAAGYLVIYGLMTIAVMLTGNFFISILGGIVLFAYVPAIVALTEGMMHLFFETMNTRGLELENLMLNGSPVSWYGALVIRGAQMGDAMNGYGTLLGSAAAGALTGTVMAVIALMLYRLRPSESAGKAMAFSVTKAPIKILLVVPITISTGVLFWNIYYSFGWSIFGFIFGLVVTHAVIEIIYHFEFRKLFANLPHMGISAVMALALIGVFRFDLIGYDKYLPEESEFQSASIYMNGLNDWREYGLPEFVDLGTENRSLSWNYVYGPNYVANNMNIPTYDLVRQLGEAGIAIAVDDKEKRMHGEDWNRDNGFWTNMEIGYHLKNGKTVYRHYTINVSALREVVDALYVTGEYKQGIYPIMQYAENDLTGVYAAKYSDIDLISEDAAFVRELFAVYKEELTALTLEERSKETPITSLRFLTSAEQSYIRELYPKQQHKDAGVWLDGMDLVNFFPVYPSFERTIALLQDAGVDDLGKLSVEDVLLIEIHSNYETKGAIQYEEYYGYTKTTPTAEAVGIGDGNSVLALRAGEDSETDAKIQEVLTHSYGANMADMNRLQPIEEGLMVRVFLKEENEERSASEMEFITCQFGANEIPEFVKEAFRYDEIEHRQVNHGLTK